MRFPTLMLVIFGMWLIQHPVLGQPGQRTPGKKGFANQRNGTIGHNAKPPGSKGNKKKTNSNAKSCYNTEKLTAAFNQLQVITPDSISQLLTNQLTDKTKTKVVKTVMTKCKGAGGNGNKKNNATINALLKNSAIGTCAFNTMAKACPEVKTIANIANAEWVV